MKFLRYFLPAIAAACTMWLAACSIINDIYPEEPPKAMPAFLRLDVAMAAGTRANTIPDNELMHSLRIVLVDGEGTVEHNGFVPPETLGAAGVSDYDYSRQMVIPTMPGRKRIYLIANEESVSEVKGLGQFAGQSLSEVLGSQGAGTADFEDIVDAIYFTPDYGQNLVLTSMYEFDIVESELPENRKVEKTFYMVHAATKFEFHFHNHREHPVTVTDLSLSSVTDDIYLMAHVNGSERDKSIDGVSYYWIDWLRKVSESTTAKPSNPENGNINEMYGWIKAYDLPSETHTSKVVVQNGSDVLPGKTTGTAPSLSLPLVYYPESRNVAAGDDQRYTLTLKLIDGHNDQNKEFETIELDNVKALFRNTHVIVNILFLGNEDEIDLQLKIGVCPWYQETINIPQFD